MKEDSETKETQDEEYFYGQSVAASIRKRGDMEKCMIKHEITVQIPNEHVQGSKYR